MSGIVEGKWIWHDGEFVEWHNAKVHLLSLAVQFGSSVFEGIRCYETPRGPAIFRWHEHLRRLYDSAKIYRMEIAQTPDELTAVVAELIEMNELSSCYIRPMILRGYGASGMLPVGCLTESWIACWPWGTYLGEGALENGVDVCVSSWNRPAPNTYPSLAKAAGHYNNAQLIKMEAVANGYAEAIALAPDGVVSEGSGQNLFLVRDGTLYTPGVDGTILEGITRATILQIAADMGIRTLQKALPREMLYTADELFFTGTAAEVTPIRSVDKIEIGTGRAGEVTLKLQRRFMDIVHGRVSDDHGWLTHVRDVRARPRLAS